MTRSEEEEWGGGWQVGGHHQKTTNETEKNLSPGKRERGGKESIVGENRRETGECAGPAETQVKY